MSPTDRLLSDVLAADVRPRQPAVEMFAELLQPADRVLLTGASGWFGRTALSLMRSARGEDWLQRNVLAGASTTRLIDVLGVGSVRVEALATARVRAFMPSVIFNFAFPPRSRVAQVGLDSYVAQAERLRADLLTWAALPSVSCVVSLASGASVLSPRYPADLVRNPYGTLKSREDESLTALVADRGVAGTLERIWAASGPHVQSPRDYAMSDFILQAYQHGEITVRARGPVIRSYCSADDELALALYASAKGVRMFDNGGIPVELSDLAETVGAICGGVPVRRPNLEPDAATDDYRGDPRAWQALAAQAGYQEADLMEQVHSARAGLLAVPFDWARTALCAGGETKCFEKPLSQGADLSCSDGWP